MAQVEVGALGACRRGALRCLVVDDEPAMLGLLGAVLGAEGLVVVATTVGAGLVERVATSAPDVVVLDLGLSDADGLAQLGALKAHPATRDVPVVVLSGRARDEDLWAGWAAGADRYITKPFDSRELLGHVRSVARWADRAPGPASRRR
ncbi:MAG TPA: response regulator [Acidimicrobiales bacterium]|nr:response regulator [Acidimicrobiales bacterium]